MISKKTPTGTVTLTAKTQTGATRQYDLYPEQGVFAGSSSNCGLQLPGAGIADIHCRIGFEGGKLYIQNWMSADGICISGDAISAKTEIGIGDVIQIGDHQIHIVPHANTPHANEPQAPTTDDTPAVENGSDEELTQYDTSQDVDSSVDAFDAAVEELELASSELDQVSVPEESMDLDVDFFDFEEEETYDRETVALLQAEIEELQAALLQRDAELQFDGPTFADDGGEKDPQASDDVLKRMQDLVDEANRSDERVAILEEMLHSAEVASQSEEEERQQLEAWVGDIEQRIGQREAEHAAEVESLRERLEESTQQHRRLQKQIQSAAFSGSAPKQYEETLDNLQSQNKELQEKLAASEKQRIAAEQQLEHNAGEQERALREERASIAKERAKVSRLRFELSSKLTDIEELPKPENEADKETSHRIQTLREHLREIHEQEKLEEREAPLTTRLKRLWKRVEY